jgi:hypothetical protein
MARRGILLIAALAGAALAGCSGAPPAPPVPPAPPAPPAACALDAEKLHAVTGVTWTAETATATATRCVYDPGGPQGPVFAAVTIAERGAAAELDTIAQACVGGTRQVVASGFVCRLGAGDRSTGSVLAATAGNGRLVTVTVSAAPAGTTADAVSRALAEQLPALS